MSLICITFATPKQESPAIAAALNKGAMDIMHWIILIAAGLCEVGFTYGNGG